MKELDFLESINDLDPQLLEEQAAPRGRKRGRTLRRAVVAAAAVLLLGGTVFAVASGIGMQRLPKTDLEDGYEAEAVLPLVPWSSFTGGIRSVGETIAAQYGADAPQPVSSSFWADPAVCRRSFADLDEAAAYLGLSELELPDFPFDGYTCFVEAHGDADGRVDKVQLCAERIVPDDICAQLSVTILTEYASDPRFVSGGVWTYEFPRDLEFQSYLTPGGLECRIAVLRPQYESRYMSLTGYAAAGSALYELNLGSVPTEDYELAMQMLRDWADGLD